MVSLKPASKFPKKDAIIQAAVSVFAEKGFYSAKVSDVAKKAGVADGTIYNYFKNKDDILISLFEKKMDYVLKQFDEALSNIPDPIKKLQLFFSTYFNIIKEDENLAEVFQVELRQSEKFLKDYHNQKFIDYLNIIATILNEGIKAGFFRMDIKVDILKVMIFGAIDEVARQWILGANAKYSLEEAAQQISKLIIDGLTAT
jgi:TetR/AcrR family fatty acid metabolism transcriptional regulator